MNRKIIFRAKRPDNNDWVYGDLLHPSCVSAGYEIHPYIRDRHACAHEVDKGTIGQFTGLYDKNGKEIYEGDIVKFPHVGECTRGIIVWNGKVGAWCIKLKGENSLGSTPVGEMLSSYKIEVIGNIHDNPELIKEEQQ